MRMMILGYSSSLISLVPDHPECRYGKHHREDVTDVEFTCWNGCEPERSVLPVRPNDNVTINNARGH